MDLILGVLGIGGVVTAAGYVALMVVAPTVAKSAGEFVAAIIDTKAAIAAIALAGGLLMGDIYRGTADRSAFALERQTINASWQKKIDDSAKAFAAERKNRDTAVEAALESANKQRQADLDAKERDWEGRFKAFQQSVESDPKCVITPEDARR